MRKGLCRDVPRLSSDALLGSDMEQFTISLRLGSRIIGRVVCTLNTKASLADAKGSLTELAQQSLGHSVVIKRFMVTSCGRTGYLHPYQEQLPIADCSPVITVTNTVADLGVPVNTQEDWNQYKMSGSPLRRSNSLSSMISAGDHFELHHDRAVQ